MKKPGFYKFLSTAVFILLTIHIPGRAAPGETGLSLIPIPERLVLNEGKLVIGAGFRVSLAGVGASHIEEAAARFLERLQRRTGIPLASKPVGSGGNPVLEILCTGKGEDIQSVKADESYTLKVSRRQARLAASSPIGIFRGLETFLQLVDIDGHSFYVPCLEIDDSPRFRWRGLLIDVSRHFEPVDMIKRNLDAMAAVKMNVLHLHLSDDQGFRVESKVFPKLHQLGSDGRYYLQSEIGEIVSYARNLGIRIVPEFDMPGHSTSWLVAYPELAAAPGPYSIERQWGVFEPCMDPTKEELYEFLDAFIGEMSALFPDEYFHIGGDEVKANQWNSSERIRDFKKRHNFSDNHDLQVYFNQRVLEILTKHGKKMIGWDEILHPELPKNIIVQSWRQDSQAKTARRGYSGILSRGYYLDHMRSASFHYSVDPLGGEAANLSEDEKSRILGGEACMWAEFVNYENIESRIWPRTAAIAERLWSPASVNDVADLYRRLEFIDRELARLGLRHHTLYLEKMQRLAGNPDMRPLLVFADLIKPPILSIRKREQTYYSHTPLNRLVDAIRPESEVARKFSLLVDARISSASDTAAASEKIRESLTMWLANDAPLQAIIERSYLLKETRQLAETVAELCKCGLEALDYMEAQQKPAKAWQDKAAALIHTAEQPRAEILIAVLPPIKELIEAAMELP